MKIREEIAKTVKDTCHFAAADGKCNTFDRCDSTACAFANEQTDQILSLIKKSVEGIETPITDPYDDFGNGFNEAIQSVLEELG